MKILVIGLGSMGRRRIRLLKRYDDESLIVGIDKQTQRCQGVRKEFDIETMEDLTVALEKYSFDCAYVATSPLTHAKLIRICLDANMHVFTEINLTSEGYEKNMQQAQMKNKCLFMSSTFLYREEVQYICNKVRETKEPLIYNYHVGQYLPDWHPWENYQNFFVADQRTNGCRELFAIELPWLLETFGEVEDIQVMKSKNSSLEVPYADNYIVTIKHNNGHKGVLCVDIIARKAARNFEVYGENVYLKWDGTPKGLQELNLEDKEFHFVDLYEEIYKVEGYSANIIENAYYCEIENFFATIKGIDKPRYNFEKDAKILQIIDEIEC